MSQGIRQCVLCSPWKTLEGFEERLPSPSPCADIRWVAWRGRCQTDPEPSPLSANSGMLLDSVHVFSLFLKYQHYCFQVIVDLLMGGGQRVKNSMSGLEALIIVI